MRGNAGPPPPITALKMTGTAAEVAQAHPDFVANLRFGDGELLRLAEGDSEDAPSGHTLKGRYIIRVGWDDVRGWLSEVCQSCLSPQESAFILD